MFQDSHEWVLWQAKQAVGEPTIEKPAPVIVAPDPVRVRKKRKMHWGRSFQQEFSAWVTGDDDRPCDLGYTRRELRRHLERQFTRGMSWDNYGCRTGWVIDHIVPKRLFDIEDVRHAYAITNLRPLAMTANLQKAGIRHHLL